MSWRIFLPSFALAGKGFCLTASSGGRPVWSWELPTRSAVTICRFPRELTQRGSSIAVRIVVRSFRVSDACVARWLVLPVAVNTTVAISICDFGYSLSPVPAVCDRRQSNSGAHRAPLQVIPLGLGRFLSPQFRLDERVDVALHHGLAIACFCSGSVIFYHLIRLKNVGANLAAPRDIAFLSILSVDFGALLILLDFVKLGFQHFYRQLPITSLAALCLTRDHDSARLMQNPNGSFHLVDVLPAFTAAAKRVDLKIGRINFYWSGISNFRNNIDTREGSVAPLVCVERRNAHQSVHAALGLQMSVRVLAGHEQGDGFDADFFALLNVHGLRFETAPFNPALVHPQQHIGPIARLRAARARMNRDKCIRAIVFA